jgi:predicted nucleic acid-binding protein
VSEAWVVNASPLILFSRIPRLDLIERLAPAILVPDAVIEEVRVGEHKDRTAATRLNGQRGSVSRTSRLRRASSTGISGSVSLR